MRALAEEKYVTPTPTNDNSSGRNDSLGALASSASPMQRTHTKKQLIQLVKSQVKNTSARSIDRHRHEIIEQLTATAWKEPGRPSKGDTKK